MVRWIHGAGPLHQQSLSAVECTSKHREAKDSKDGKGALFRSLPSLLTSQPFYRPPSGSIVDRPSLVSPGGEGAEAQG